MNPTLQSPAGSHDRVADAAVPDPSAPSARSVSNGLFALTGMCVLMMAMIGEVIPPVVVFALAFLGIGIALRRSVAPPKGLRIAALVLPVLLVLANGPFVVSDFSHPDSPGGFLPTLVLVVLALTTAALALGLVRGQPSRSRLAWGAAGAVVAGGVALSLVAASGVESVEAQPGDVEVAASSFEYPERVTVPAGGATLHVTNDDPVHHTFVVEGSDAKVGLPAGASQRLEVDLAPGEYRYFCDVIGHEAMTGTLVVG